MVGGKRAESVIVFGRSTSRVLEPCSSFSRLTSRIRESRTPLCARQSVPVNQSVPLTHDLHFVRSTSRTSRPAATASWSLARSATTTARAASPPSASWFSTPGAQGARRGGGRPTTGMTAAAAVTGAGRASAARIAASFCHPPHYAR